MRAGHGSVQGRESAVTGSEHHSDGVRATVLPDGDGGRQDLPGQTGEFNRARTADTFGDSAHYSQLAGDALLPALADPRAQAGDDSLRHTAGPLGLRGGHRYYVPCSYLPTCTSGVTVAHQIYRHSTFVLHLASRLT